MLRKTLIAAAAAAVLGAISSFAMTAPAQAVPLTSAIQVKPHADLSTVTEVGSRKKRWRKRHGGYHKRYRRGRPSVSFSFGLAPGFYIGSGYHPRYRVHSRAPYHCHRFRDRFGHRHKTCHRHH